MPVLDQHELGVIARALRNLTRIGDAHAAELRELQTVVFTRAENAELAEAVDTNA